MPDRIDGLITQSQQRIEPTLSDIKLQNLTLNKEAKLNNLQNKFTGMYDADSPFYKNGLHPTARIGGVDGRYGNAPEMKENGQLNNEGMNARIRTDNFLMGVGSDTGDADLDPKYYQQYQDAMNKSLQEEAILGNIQFTGADGHQGKYDRQILDITKDGQSLNEDLQDRYGVKYANVDAQGKPVDRDGRIGEFADLVQSSLIQQYGKTNKALRKISRGIAEFIGVDQENVDKYLPENSEALFFDKTSENLAKAEIADIEAGVNPNTRAAFQMHQKRSIKAIENGKYGEAAWDIVKNLDRHLANSAGEMVSLVSYPTTALAIAARLSEQAEEYEKNNGKAPDTEWFITNGAVQSALLLGDKFLIKTGALGALEKGTAGARVGRVGTSVAGEAVQEAGDTISEEYFTQREGDRTLGEIATSPETQYATMTGGLTAGGLKSAAEVTTSMGSSAKEALTEKISKIGEEKQVKSPKQTETLNTITKLSKVAETSGPGSFSSILDRVDKLDYQDDKQAKEAVDNLYKIMADKVSKSSIQQEDIDKLNLGSEQETIDFIESMYESATDKESPTLFNNMVTIGKKFNMTPEAVKTIKDTAMVEVEATTSAKGYKTYDRTLTRLMKDPEGNSQAIENVKARLEHFENTQIDRLDRLQKAINEIQANLKAGTESRTKVNVPYAGGGKYTIHIKDGKINPATIGGVNAKGEKVPGVLADIQRTIDGIGKVLDKHGIERTDTAEYNPYSPEGKWRVPATAGKGKARLGTLKKLMSQIKDGKSIFMPIGSKRSKIQTITARKLKKEGYVEVNKDGHPTVNSGIWVPQDKVKIDEKKVEEKQQRMEKKEVVKVATRMKKKEDLTEEEKEFAKAHAAEVKQVLKEYNVIEEINKIDDSIAVLEEEIAILQDTDASDLDILNIQEKIDKLVKDKDNILSKNVIEEVLKSNPSTQVKEFNKPIGQTKFIQPLNINEYVTTKGTPSLLASVKVEFFSNSIVKEARTLVPSILKKILAKVDYKVDEKYKTQKEMYNLASSPARGLIFDSKGEVHENVAVAIDAALTEYIAMGGMNLGPKTKEQIALMLGLQEGEVTAEAVRKFKDVGMYSKNVANDIGKAIISSLGLKENPNIPQDLYAKLVADLGNIAIHVGIDNGVIEFYKDKDGNEMTLKSHNAITGHTVSEGTNINTTVPFVRFTKTGKDQLPMYKKQFDDYKEALHIEDNFTKGPLVKPSKNKKLDIRNNPITEQPEKGNKTLNVLRSEKYVKMQSSIDWLIDPNNRDTALHHLGYKTDKEMKNMSFFDRESQEAKNEEVVRSLDFLKDVELDEMYFEWFYSRNGRYMMDSNTINPQTDKLHRFAIVPDNHRVNLDKANKEHMTLFKTALAQAFGMATDKKPTDKIQEFGEMLLKKDPNELMKMLETNEFTDDIEVEHLSHYLQGVEALRRYHSSEDGKFTTHLSMESDAVTSGFGLKLLQLPILADREDKKSVLDNVKDWMAKTGLFVGKEIDSMNDEVSKDGFNDSYETLAKQVNHFEVNPDNYGTFTTKAGAEKNEWDFVTQFDDSVPHELFVKTLPTANDDGTVSKTLRTLFKDPFMTFNYSRGVSSIKKGLGFIIADGLISKFVSGEMTTDEKLLLNKLKAVYGLDLVKNLMSKDPNTIKGSIGGKNVSIYDYLSQMGTNTYGHLAAKSLNENFAKFNEANEVINKAFNDMFIAYNEAYMEAVEATETKNKRGITKKENLEIIQSLRSKFPLIKGPYSKLDDLSDTVAIYDTTNATSVELENSYGTVSTKLANGKSKKVQSKIKQLKASLKAGSVIPIHYIDAAVIGNTIRSSKGILGIHDAIIPNLLDMKNVVKEYNKNVIEVNKEYSVVESLLDSYQRVMKSDTSEEVAETMQQLQDLVDEAKLYRDKIFSDNIDVVHMSAVPGSKYSYKGSKPSTNKVEEIGYNDKQKKALLEYLRRPGFKQFLKNNSIDLKDC